MTKLVFLGVDAHRTNPLRDHEVCLLRGAQEGVSPPQSAPGRSGSGWIWNKRVNCPVYRGTLICSLCIRSGFDLRLIMCPWSDNS